MSMVLVWYASVIVGCDRIRSGLSDAPLHITLQHQQNRGIAITLTLTLKYTKNTLKTS